MSALAEARRFLWLHDLGQGPRVDDERAQMIELMRDLVSQLEICTLVTDRRKNKKPKASPKDRRKHA